MGYAFPKIDRLKVVQVQSFESTLCLDHTKDAALNKKPDRIGYIVSVLLSGKVLDGGQTWPRNLRLRISMFQDCAVNERADLWQLFHIAMLHKFVLYEKPSGFSLAA